MWGVLRSVPDKCPLAYDTQRCHRTLSPSGMAKKTKHGSKHGLLGPVKPAASASQLSPGATAATGKKQAARAAAGARNGLTGGEVGGASKAQTGDAAQSNGGGKQATKGTFDRVTGKKRGTLFSAVPRATTNGHQHQRAQHAEAGAAGKRADYTAVAPPLEMTAAKARNGPVSGAPSGSGEGARQPQKRSRPGGHRAACAEGSEPSPLQSNVQQAQATEVPVAKDAQDGKHVGRKFKRRRRKGGASTTAASALAVSSCMLLCSGNSPCFACSACQT